MRFLFSRRWLLFGLAVLLLAWAATALGQWQFRRLDDRRHDNRVVAANLDTPPVPVEQVLSVDDPPDHDEEWKRVTVHGKYDDAHTVVLKYQTRDGQSGVDVVTPLVTEAGPAVLVDRGWLRTENSGARRPDVPDAAEGTVTVTGWVRADAEGGATKVDALSTRALSSRTISEVVPYDLYQGFLELDQQRPAAGSALKPVQLPDDTSEGPHFFYGLQWWFFGALAVFGFLYLAWDEWRRREPAARTAGTPQPAPAPRPVGPDGSQRAEQSSVDREHHAGHER